VGIVSFVVSGGDGIEAGFGEFFGGGGLGGLRLEEIVEAVVRTG
jgi:hypothetical protein